MMLLVVVAPTEPQMLLSLSHRSINIRQCSHALSLLRRRTVQFGRLRTGRREGGNGPNMEISVIKFE